MQISQKLNYKKVIWIADTALAAVLFHEGISVVKSFCTYPDYALGCLFPNTLEVRQIIQRYKAKKLKVEPRKYIEEIEHAEYTAGMLKEEISYQVKNRRNSK